MWRFAWRNILTRPTRTLLALIGLSIPILGVVGLFSLSKGLRLLVGNTLNQVQGVIVLRNNSPSPVFSDIPADLPDKIRAVPGVKIVSPELWGISPPIENTNLIARTLSSLGDQQKRMQSLLDTPVIAGQEPVSHGKITTSVYLKSLLKPEDGGGRYLDERDIGTNNVVISKKYANQFKNPDGSPKKPGDSLKIGKDSFTVIGVYDTNSMLLDGVLVMNIDTARRILNRPGGLSDVYVEMTDPAKSKDVSEAIEAQFPDYDARSMSEFATSFGNLMGQLDRILALTVSLALAVGVVGIVNTMLMSTLERMAEFGVLRTNGWSSLHVMRLVTLESAYLGLCAGILGCVLAIGGATVANQFLGGGIQLVVTPWLLILGMGLSIFTGTLGGLYPAWKASHMAPMEAIRLGHR
jgi:putative ABC transport system permease protein